jgi:hypothetical protein
MNVIRRALQALCHRHKWWEFKSCGRRYRRCECNELQQWMLVHNGSDKAWVPVLTVKLGTW